MFCEAIEKGQSIHGVKGIKQRRVRRPLRESLVKPSPTIYPVTLPL
jgi:hypothetical protein